MTSLDSWAKCRPFVPLPRTRFSVAPRSTPSKAPTLLDALFWLLTNPSRLATFAVFVVASYVTQVPPLLRCAMYSCTVWYVVDEDDAPAADGAPPPAAPAPDGGAPAPEGAPPPE